MSKNKNGIFSNKFYIFIICLSLFFIVVIGASFIVYSNREPVVIKEEKNGGKVSLLYTTTLNSLSLKDSHRVDDNVGINSKEYFDFSVDVKLNEAPYIEYEISVEKDEESSNLPEEDIKIYLEKEIDGSYSKIFGPSFFEGISAKTSLGSPVNSMVIASANKNKSGVDNYRLRMWLSDLSKVESGDFSVIINVYALSK